MLRRLFRWLAWVVAAHVALAASGQGQLLPSPRARVPDLAPHEWTTLRGGLVAHALGAADGFAGTNSREAMEANYALGHRVFELDLCLTADGDLAVVHDWAGIDGGVKTAAAWRDTPVNYYYHSLMLDDVLDFMAARGDMYIITDTKSFDLPIEDTRLQFRLIYEKAKARGVLDKIVPQIYNRAMYDEIRAVYPWQSVIYTLYASEDSNTEVIDFVQLHDDVQVVTMGTDRYQYSDKHFLRYLTLLGKYVYFYTINDSDEMAEYRALGVHGFYTDFVAPSD